jgi:hypothetical protein
VFLICTWNSFWRLMSLWVFFRYVGATGVLSASVSDFMVYEGELPFSSISHKVGSIPEELLLGKR